jgi:hypothetical protein
VTLPIPPTHHKKKPNKNIFTIKSNYPCNMQPPLPLPPSPLLPPPPSRPPPGAPPPLPAGAPAILFAGVVAGVVAAIIAAIVPVIHIAHIITHVVACHRPLSTPTVIAQVIAHRNRRRSPTQPFGMSRR